MRHMTCTSCSRELTGDPSCDIFFCHPCFLAYPLQERTIRSYPLSYARPAQAVSQSIVWIPFWHMEADIRIVRADERQRRTWSKMTPWNGFFLPAFWSPLADSLSGLAVSMSLLPPGTITKEKRYDPIYRPTRSTEGLRKIAKLLLIQHLDRACDVTGAGVFIQPHSYSLIAVPFFRNPHGPGWWNALTGEDYPDNLLP